MQQAVRDLREIEVKLGALIDLSQTSSSLLRSLDASGSCSSPTAPSTPAIDRSRGQIVGGNRTLNTPSTPIGGNRILNTPSTPMGGNRTLNTPSTPLIEEGGGNQSQLVEVNRTLAEQDDLTLWMGTIARAYSEQVLISTDGGLLGRSGLLVKFTRMG